MDRKIGIRFCTAVVLAAGSPRVQAQQLDATENAAPGIENPREVVTYDAEFFARYQPNSARDLSPLDVIEIRDRTDGIRLVLTLSGSF